MILTSNPHRLIQTLPQIFEKRFEELEEGQAFRLSALGHTGPTVFKKVAPGQRLGQPYSAEADDCLYWFGPQTSVVLEQCRMLSVPSCP